LYAIRKENVTCLLHVSVSHTAVHKHSSSSFHPQLSGVHSSFVFRGYFLFHRQHISWGRPSRTRACEVTSLWELAIYTSRLLASYLWLNFLLHFIGWFFISLKPFATDFVKTLLEMVAISRKQITFICLLSDIFKEFPAAAKARPQFRKAMSLLPSKLFLFRY